MWAMTHVILMGKNTVYYIGMPIALTPFSDNTFRIVPRKDVLNDQLKGLNSQMVKHFDMEGIKKLGGVKYKPYINVEQREDPYILLDVHWKSEQLSFSNTLLWWGTMRAILENQEKILNQQ